MPKHAARQAGGLASGGFLGSILILVRNIVLNFVGPVQANEVQGGVPKRGPYGLSVFGKIIVKRNGCVVRDALVLLGHSLPTVATHTPNVWVILSPRQGSHLDTKCA